MQFIRKYKFALVLLAVLVVLAAITLRVGEPPGDIPEIVATDETAVLQGTENPEVASHDMNPEPEKKESTPRPERIPEETETPPGTEVVPQEAASTPQGIGGIPAEATETASYAQEEPVPWQMPACLLSVRCDSVFEKLSDLKKGKIDSIPADGIIYAEKAVVFSEGESAFDVLKREMEKENIPLDYANNALFDSAYIKGISGLYERDCGGLSGWTYEVNGAFQNKGCSKYILQNGDRVEFIYSCG